MEFTFLVYSFCLFYYVSLARILYLNRYTNVVFCDSLTPSKIFYWQFIINGFLLLFESGNKKFLYYMNGDNQNQYFYAMVLSEFHNEQRLSLSIASSS